MTTPRAFTFYEYAQLGPGAKNGIITGFFQPPEYPGFNTAAVASADLRVIGVRLTDDDDMLEDKPYFLPIGDVDQGEPQVLTRNVVSNDGTILGLAGTGVYALGQGSFTNQTTGETGLYMIVGPSNDQALSWGVVTNPRLNPGDSLVFGPVDYLVNNLRYEDIYNPPCFTAGTLIETAAGPVAIEDLRPGHMVLTYGGAYQPLKWVSSARISANRLRNNDKLAPIVITAGALGDRRPLRDLRVSRQHRILVSSSAVHSVVGAETALIAAFRLIEMPGIYIDKECREVEYFHMLFEKHEVVVSEGTYSESLFLGPEVIKNLSFEALEEIQEIFPDLISKITDPETEFVIPSAQDQNRIVLAYKNAQI